jgi:putative DNA primase/helicase
LPESLRAWIADIADRMQCPPDFVAVAAMTALSSIVGRKACIAPKRHDDWRVIPNLWAVVVGRPGVMKSPALAEAMKPLYRLQEETDKAFHATLRNYELDTELRDMSGRQTKIKAREAMQNGDEQEARKLLEASRTIEADKPPARRRYVVNDSSVEALGEILIENPWGLLAYRDELHGLLCSMEKEGQEGARAFYLQGYDGNQGYTFDRIGRGKNLTIPAVCIALLGGIQPGKLASYIRDAVSGGRGDDGLLQRFGLLVWPDDSGWKNVDRYPDVQAKQRAFETFKRLDGMEPALSETGDAAPREYRFTPDAQDVFDRWRCAFENDLRQNPERHPAMESHLAKYRKLVPALALVIALADGEDAVSRAALLMALGWAKYLQSHAERAYATGTGPRVGAARALLDKIGKGDLSDGFSARAVYRKGWANLTTEKDATLAAEILCDLGYLKAMEIPSGTTGGRPTVNYLIHPDYLPKKEA